MNTIVNIVLRMLGKMLLLLTDNGGGHSDDFKRSDCYLVELEILIVLLYV